MPVFFSCAQKQPGLKKVWFYKEKLTHAETMENIRKYGGTAEYGLNDASFIDLQEDSSFTSYFSAFSHRSWAFQDSVLTLTDQNKKKLELSVREVTEEDLVCVNPRTGKVFRFKGFNNDFASEEENPFSIQNNRWRIRAKKKESDAEILARLKNHFRFWEKYFAWALKADVKLLSIKNVPTPLDMYGNGFKLEYFDRQTDEWKNFFYDSADCWRAYEKMHYLLWEKNIKWPETENRFEAFVSAFQQMQGWIK